LTIDCVQEEFAQHHSSGFAFFCVVPALLDLDAYRAFCDTRSDIPLFHQPWWLDAASPGAWTGLVVTDGEDRTGIWPLTTVRRGPFNLIGNSLMTPYLGPALFLPDNLTAVRRADAAFGLAHALVSALPRAHQWRVAMTPATTVEAGLFSSAGFAVSARQTYWLRLGETPLKTVLARAHTNIRRALRRAADAGLVIAEESTAVDHIYALLQRTVSRRGARLPYAEADLRRLCSASLTRGRGRLITARNRAGALLGAQWTVWDATTAYNLLNARVDGPDAAFVPTAMLWASITHAHTFGLRTYDFEGSMIPGVETFFRSFGGEKTMYFTLFKTPSRALRMLRLLRG